MPTGYIQTEESRKCDARILSRNRDMHPQRLNLNMVLVDMTRSLEHAFGPDIALEIECEQDLPPIIAVANMVKLALMNLATIARAEINGRGKIVIRAALKTVEESAARRSLESQRESFVCLQIQHSGLGKAEAFDASSRLATIYGIAQQHCGWLDVARDAQSGTAYNLYFRIASKNEAVSQRDDHLVEIPGGDETILLVEDELDLLSLTREILERYGYRILSAPNGRSALNVWNERRGEIDLLLTDMRMPEGINGYELAERCLSDKPMLKVIYVSGYSIEPGPSVRLEEGQNFLTKPYTPPGLARAVRRMLDCAETAPAACEI